uniref:Uncharacterized protein n=1 Tax=Manihot esculenta TaxID=3983 RepID=A0A2C9VQI4_MANES
MVGQLFSACILKCICCCRSNLGIVYKGYYLNALPAFSICLDAWQVFLRVSSNIREEYYFIGSSNARVSTIKVLG